jgi:4-hydroxythreonine-4-phosphate dehydrogenase
MTMTLDNAPPTIALAIGDPAGIGPELAARALVDPDLADVARYIVVGDRRVLGMGATHADLELDIPCVSDLQAAARDDRPAVMLDCVHADLDSIVLGQATRAGGASALGNFAAALRLARDGLADAVVFTPFNKQAMRLAWPAYVDETGYIAAVLDSDVEGREFNVLDEVWNARVTSHVPLSQVAGLIGEQRVLDSILFTDRVMRAAGIERPRLGVAALNPHAGDGGNFGAEDDLILVPAVAAAKARQVSVEGPIPSDTVFVRATKGEFDAVVTMYHDQGQIAMKLLGFERGVTYLGGYPFPITTPAHGSAYDIAGAGRAATGATVNAIRLAATLARRLGGTDRFPGLAERVQRLARLPSTADLVAVAPHR